MTVEPEVLAELDQRAARARNLLDRIMMDGWLVDRADAANPVSIAALSAAITVMTDAQEMTDALALAMFRLVARS